MGVSKNDLRAVNLEDGRTCLMHLLFDGARQVLPDADEPDEDGVECSFGCTCAPSAEDVAIAIEDGDEDFLRAHSLFHLLFEEDTAFSDAEPDIDPETHFDNVLFFSKGTALLPTPNSGISTPKRTSVTHSFPQSEEDVEEAMLLLFAHHECKRASGGDCSYSVHHKVTYGPHGERVEKYFPCESHGVHGRKRLRPKRLTIRGARVRADIIRGPRGPQCVGLVAAPRRVK